MKETPQSKAEWWYTFFKGIIVYIALAAILFPLWNFEMVKFGLPTINYLDAITLILIVQILLVPIKN